MVVDALAVSMAVQQQTPASSRSEQRVDVAQWAVIDVAIAQQQK